MSSPVFILELTFWRGVFITALSLDRRPYYPNRQGLHLGRRSLSTAYFLRGSTLHLLPKPFHFWIWPQDSISLSLSLYVYIYILTHTMLICYQLAIIKWWFQKDAYPLPHWASTLIIKRRRVIFIEWCLRFTKRRMLTKLSYFWHYLPVQWMVSFANNLYVETYL